SEDWDRLEQISMSIAGGERTTHGFERPGFRRNGPACSDEGCGQHQNRAEEIPPEQAPTRAAVDQPPKQPRASNSANAGAEGIEKRNGERSDLEREGF